MSGTLLGIDLGSSSVKVSVVEAATGEVLGSAQYPKEEMRIVSPQPGWAEQDPELWWENTKLAIADAIEDSASDPGAIRAIGVAYQMHGLVAVDHKGLPVRPSIIWCDSRAAGIGENAFNELGVDFCLSHYLNSPGNFTASKLAWVRENEPETYSRIQKIMLPGDYIAMKLTGRISTTVTGLSEGIFWDYKTNALAHDLLDHYNIAEELLPERVDCFTEQGQILSSVASEFGMSGDVVLTYRAGDQPNNALSLNVLDPGETAATAGTSGVIYAVSDKPLFDGKSRVNTFVHVNHFEDHERYGVLLCINGTGIMNNWVRQISGRERIDYQQMNVLAAEIPAGSEGLRVFPFGNGVERVFENTTPGASITGLDLNRHGPGHLFRATQEGIAFGLRYGFDVLQNMGIETSVIRAGNANMFLSEVFAQVFAETIGVPVEVYDTDGSIGAARGAGMGAGIYSSAAEAFSGMKLLRRIDPTPQGSANYDDLYQQWKACLPGEIQQDLKK